MVRPLERSVANIGLSLRGRASAVKAEGRAVASGNVALSPWDHQAPSQLSRVGEWRLSGPVDGRTPPRQTPP